MSNSQSLEIASLNTALEAKALRHRVKEFYLQSEPFPEVTGTLIYIGCLYELSSLWQFPNATTYIHQDSTPPELSAALQVMEEQGVISQLQSDEEKAFPRKVRTYTFQRNGVLRNLMEINEYLELYLHSHIQLGLEAIYFAGVPYPATIRSIQIKLLPHLKIGGIVSGPYPYRDGSYEAVVPEKIGLERAGHFHKKIRHLSSADIRLAQLQNSDEWGEEVMRRKWRNEAR